MSMKKLIIITLLMIATTVHADFLTGVIVGSALSNNSDAPVVPPNEVIKFNPQTTIQCDQYVIPNRLCRYKTPIEGTIQYRCDATKTFSNMCIKYTCQLDNIKCVRRPWSSELSSYVFEYDVIKLANKQGIKTNTIKSITQTSTHGDFVEFEQR